MSVSIQNTDFSPRWKKNRHIILQSEQILGNSFRLIRLNKKSIRVKWHNGFCDHETIICDTSQFYASDKKRVFYKNK